MPITNRDMYHGAALTQIAEHAQFTAVNPARLDDNRLSESAFLINDGIVIYLKYSAVESDTYTFNFDQNHQEEIERLGHLHAGRVFIVLVCVEVREICCITYEEWDERRNREGQYATFYVQLQPGQSFRVSTPGTRDAPQVVYRRRFPDAIFE